MASENELPTANLAEAGQLVDRAIRAAVPPGHLVERKIRPESMFGWEEPTPLAGLRAALAVARLAEQRAHRYAVKLRGEGSSWAGIADLLGVPYSDEYSRVERAYELVLGPAPEGSSPWDQRNVYWECRGPQGCGKYITDRGPYESYPSDNERGHAEDCRRIAAEDEAHRRASEERDRRARVSEAAFEALTDPFDRATVERCWWSLRRGGEISGLWSTSEQLAVALVLGDDKFLGRTAYLTRADAIERVYATTPAKVRSRLAALRAAATGEPEQAINAAHDVIDSTRCLDAERRSARLDAAGEAAADDDGSEATR